MLCIKEKKSKLYQTKQNKNKKGKRKKKKERKKEKNSSDECKISCPAVLPSEGKEHGVV